MVAFLVDVGKTVKPFVTPDDPDAFEAVLHQHGIDVVADESSAPII